MQAPRKFIMPVEGEAAQIVRAGQEMTAAQEAFARAAGYLPPEPPSADDTPETIVAEASAPTPHATASLADDEDDDA
ncbi:MAG: hypothetical protein K2Q06_06110 [Parvularculaceae bacterium]|nr:hypothetical protein [Parvularculaceae bacterium]